MAGFGDDYYAISEGTDGARGPLMTCRQVRILESDFLKIVKLPNHGEKMVTPIVTRLNLTKRPQSLWESTPMVIPQRTYAPAVRSARKTRGERALYVSFASVTEIIGSASLHCKGNPFTKCNEVPMNPPNVL